MYTLKIGISSFLITYVFELYDLISKKCTSLRQEVDNKIIILIDTFIHIASMLDRTIGDLSLLMYYHILYQYHAMDLMLLYMYNYEDIL